MTPFVHPSATQLGAIASFLSINVTAILGPPIERPEAAS